MSILSTASRTVLSGVRVGMWACSTSRKVMQAVYWHRLPGAALDRPGTAEFIRHPLSSHPASAYSVAPLLHHSKTPSLPSLHPLIPSSPSSRRYPPTQVLKVDAGIIGGTGIGERLLAMPGEIVHVPTSEGFQRGRLVDIEGRKVFAM